MKDKPMLIMRYGRAIAAMALVALLTPALPACEQYEQMPTIEPERDEDTFRIGILDNFKSLHPFEWSPIHSNALIYDVMKSQSWTNIDGSINIAAENIAVSADGKECIITLRKGMLFHNGAEITAKDVLFSLNLYSDSYKPERGATIILNYNNGFNVNIIDKYNLRIHSEDSDCTRSTELEILNADYESKFKNKSEYYIPMGSGPYKFIGYDKNIGLIKLERWDKYWAGKAKYKYIEIQRFTHADAQTMALLEGKIDFAYCISFEDIFLIRKNKELKDTKILDGTYVEILLNRNLPKFKDRRIRKALSLLIDRERLVNSKKGLNGFGIPTDTVINFVIPRTKPTIVDGYNPDQAAILLAEAGCKLVENVLTCNDKPLSIDIMVYQENYLNILGTIRMVAQKWNEAGIPTTIKSLDSNSIINNSDRNNYEAFIYYTFDRKSLNSLLNRYINCEGAYFCLNDQKNIRVGLEKFAYLSREGADEHILLDVKKNIQKSMRDYSSNIPLFYTWQIAAIRGAENFDAAFMLDPLTLSYQARPSLIPQHSP